MQYVYITVESEILFWGGWGGAKFLEKRTSRVPQTYGRQYHTHSVDRVHPWVDRVHP